MAIIAYNPKVTRAEIEQIRGVNSDGTIYKLLEHGLIEEAGRLDAPGRPTIYRTTSEFLRMFGYTSEDELPELPKYKIDENEQIVIDEIIEAPSPTEGEKVNNIKDEVEQKEYIIKGDLKMANNDFVKEINNIEEDFAKWYTDIVLKADLADYTDTKGCIAIKPYGYSIWENIQKYTDDKFKEVGVKNVYFPVLIPESLLEKEKDHVEGFAPEVAWVTMGGLNQLQERLCVRPTSETLFCDFYKDEIQSYRDLPKVYNQWCSVVRWEKETRPFLRSREFLWQEGHTAHATDEDAEARTQQMLNFFTKICV